MWYLDHLLSLALLVVLAVFPVVMVPDPNDDRLKHYILAGIFALFTYGRARAACMASPAVCADAAAPLASFHRLRAPGSRPFFRRSRTASSGAAPRT